MARVWGKKLEPELPKSSIQPSALSIQPRNIFVDLREFILGLATKKRQLSIASSGNCTG
jgi:hypothetical protein